MNSDNLERLLHILLAERRMYGLYPGSHAVAHLRLRVLAVGADRQHRPDPQGKGKLHAILARQSKREALRQHLLDACREARPL